jgi:hypothetical protein
LWSGVGGNKLNMRNFLIKLLQKKGEWDVEIKNFYFVPKETQKECIFVKETGRLKIDDVHFVNDPSEELLKILRNHK